MIRIELTDRALSDLLEIEAYSIRHFGEKTATQYISRIETALSMLEANPGLLNSKSAVSDHFKFYRAGEHILVCTRQAETLIVLTVKHVQMDIPSRISELEPTLLQEAEILYFRLTGSSGSTSHR